jgi:hypothetical protein
MKHLKTRNNGEQKNKHFPRYKKKKNCNKIKNKQINYTSDYITKYEEISNFITKTTKSYKIK